MDKYCIKCTSQENLSIKYRTRVGKEPRYICNECRMNDYRARPKKIKEPKLSIMEDWDRLFKESYERLSKRAVKITRVKVAKQLTVKEAKLVKAKVQGKTHREAMEEAGYSLGENNPDKVARVNASKTLAKPHVKEALDKALVRHGITLDTAIAPIGKGLHAMKQNEYTGEITEDIKLQLQASDRALKLMGVGQSKDDVTTQNFIQINNDIRNKYV